MFHTEARGYGGPIRLLVTTRGTALGRLAITGHTETPGIADFLDDPNGWLSDLQGRPAEALARVDAVAGATISARAITDELARLLTLTDPAPPIGKCSS